MERAERAQQYSETKVNGGMKTYGTEESRVRWKARGYFFSSPE